MTTPDGFTDDLMDLITDTEIDAECPNCGKDLQISIAKIGTSIICPHCGEEIALEAE